MISVVQMLVCAVLLLAAVSTVSARLYLIELDDGTYHPIMTQVAYFDG
jgi:hypothetical protein